MNAAPLRCLSKRNSLTWRTWSQPLNSCPASERDSAGLEPRKRPNEGDADGCEVAIEEDSSEDESNVSHQTRMTETSINPRLELYHEYKQYPTIAFDRPIFYRVIDEESPTPASDGALLPRLQPAPQKISRQRMPQYLHHQADRFSRKPTPFISTTIGLLRAFNLAESRVCEGKQGVTILLIDPWKVGGGHYTEAIALHTTLWLIRDVKYETEVLVWGRVPSEAILARWTWKSLDESGIFKALPSLDKVSRCRGVQDLRSKLQADRGQVSVSKVLRALHRLNMNPSSFHTKQVFEFLLGQASGYRVPRHLLEIEGILLVECPSEMEEYERCAHELATILGGKALISLYQEEQNSQESKSYGEFWAWKTPREWRKLRAAFRLRYFCPDFKHWWARREESDPSELEAYELGELDTYGIKGWMLQ